MTAKFARRDLLIDPKGPHWVIEDKGITWVTDRYVMVRADLFKSPPKDTSKRPLQKSSLRQMLAKFRGPGRSLRSTRVALRDNEARLYSVGSGHAFVLLNERVTRGYYLAGLLPRYISDANGVAWYGKRRGKDVLCAVQMTKMHIGAELQVDDLMAVPA